MTDAAAVARHYQDPDLVDRLRAALAAAGLEGRTLSAVDLAPLDQFHTRGLAATVELAATLELRPEIEVLDVGSGLGGPSRYIAETFGCHVVGIDLSSSFVEAAADLAERAGLADRVRYDCGSALALPYEAGRFDVVWTQHVAMNIADRARLYAEMFRVLRPGGRLAIYDIVAGDGRPLHVPVPWSRTPDTSFLLAPTAMRTALEQQGFRVASWIDRTPGGIAWFDAMQQTQAAGPTHPLGLHVAMGPDFKHMAANLGRNLNEGRVGLIEAVLERP